ncbi:hypothetical protein [Larkinella terrae]|uniref:Uncharacterized protein n=1 Tax=Larkinella terrae TaxID=2025311 RepID=A0A7K0EI22_9BACT|nr:hypothetical protein [Larkinella terrae]MRS61241.1 hypothetical protein [Larkinella terrae]
MLITNQFTHITGVIPIIQDHARKLFDPKNQNSFLNDAVQRGLRLYLDQLKDNIWICVESPYVDRIYRDSYYHYYASKLGSYPKDCIRLSFFDVPIDESHFRNQDQRTFLQEHYLGFLVVRPTFRNLIGRNIISPKALKDSNIQVCLAKYSVTVNSIKLEIWGFPHSSQDIETITCAQTTIWSIMEYFSQRYADYRPVLPSTIVKRLENLSVERQMPATGLSIEQISFVLKEFDFGPRIYHEDKYPKDFAELVSCYVESGIPIVVAIQNRNKSVGHALLCIGRQIVTKEYIKKNLKYEEFKLPTGTIQLMDLDKLPKDFVFIDDNLAPYAQATLSRPASNYVSKEWHSCKLVAFVAPLYKRVYLEAYEAKKYLKSLFSIGIISIQGQHEVILRFFLTSSRSYKNWVATDAVMGEVLKEIILAVALPKFIWVGELTNSTLLEADQANGIVLLDATEADTNNLKPLILVAQGDRIINFAAPELSQRLVSIPIQPFTRYQNNLA